MAEGIEIHFDEEEGHLRLDCNEEEFNRIRDLVISGGSVSDRLGPFMDGIQSIALRRLAAARDTAPRRFRRGCQILLVSLALAVTAAIQVVGLVTIARWLLRLGS